MFEKIQELLVIWLMNIFVILTYLSNYNKYMDSSRVDVRKYIRVFIGITIFYFIFSLILFWDYLPLIKR